MMTSAAAPPINRILACSDMVSYDLVREVQPARTSSAQRIVQSTSSSVSVSATPFSRSVASTVAHVFRVSRQRA